MRVVYRVLAYLIAIEVMIQAAALAYGIFGMRKWVDDEGGVVDAATMQSGDADFEGLIGLIIHGMNGMMVIPFIALLLLVVSFFTKIPGASRWAALIFLLVGIQIALGISAPDLPILGALHGFNALLLFGAAVRAGMRARKVVYVPAAAPVGAAAPGYPS